MEEQELQRLKQMLNVKIERIEEKEDALVVYVSKADAAKAIGASGCVVRAAELVLNKKLLIKESASNI